jgi:hypothetical protein
MRPFHDGIWLDTAPVRFLGMQLTVNMTVVEIGDGRLLVHSPLELTPERQGAVSRLGSVAHLYAPNLFHHLHIGEWAEAFPHAVVHAPPGLASKRPDLRIDRVHGSKSDPAWSAAVDEIPIEGFRLEESVLFHERSATLVVADLVHAIGRPEQRWASIYTRVMGFRDRVALSRMIRWTAFPDRPAARRSLEHVLARPFERVVVGHGAPIESRGCDALAAAYAWLRPARPSVATPSD